MLGRADDCGLRLSGVESVIVSWHHWLLRIDPLALRVRELNRRHRIRIKGMQIGHLAAWHRPPALTTPCAEYDLHDGDELQVWDTVFEVGIRADAQDRPDTGVEAPAEHFVPAAERPCGDGPAGQDPAPIRGPPRPWGLEPW